MSSIHCSVVIYLSSYAKCLCKHRYVVHGTHSIYIMIGSVWLTCLNFHHQLKSFFSAETLMIACNIFKFDCGRTESAGVLDYMNLTLCEFKCLCDTMIGLTCS